MSSYGDFTALSDECDVQTAEFLKHEVSDGVIAPSYSAEALAILKTKRKGNYLIIQMDPAYEPAPVETKQVFGVTFSQKRNDVAITEDCLTDIPTQAKDFPAAAKTHSPTPSATPMTARPSASVPASSPASTARASRAARPTIGSCARHRKC